MARVKWRGVRPTKNRTYRWWTINGKCRLVKLRRIGGREQIRMAGLPSTGDCSPARIRTWASLLAGRRYDRMSYWR